MKKNWLLLLGLILSLSIVTFGSASYEKTLVSQPMKDDSIIEKSNDNKVDEVKNIPTNLNPDKKNNKREKTTTAKTKEEEKKQNQTVVNEIKEIATQTPEQAPIVNPEPIIYVAPPTQPPVLTPLSPTQDQSSNNNISQKTVNLFIESIGSYKVDWSNGDSAWDIMKKASAKYHFDMTYKIYPFGIYVMMIGDKKSEGNYYWSLYYNGSYSMQGASDLKVQANDEISWKYETFSW
jgi:hypothetical protein